MYPNMSIKYVDIQYLRAQNANQGQLILAGQSNTLTYTQSVTVGLDGRVGIGTSQPASELTVNGNIQILGSTSSIIFPDNTTLSSAVQFESSGALGTIQFAGANKVLDGDSTHLFWDSGNLRLGIGTSTPVSTLQINYTAIESTSTSFSGTSPAVLDSFPANKVRSAHYFVQVTDEVNSHYHTCHINVVQDGVNAWKSEYGIVTSAERLGNFDCTINNGNLTVLFTAFQAGNKSVKITRTSMTA